MLNDINENPSRLPEERHRSTHSLGVVHYVSIP
jgi:hypothetical protein